MSGFHLMAKPFGPICNLRCEYCFYFDHEKSLTPLDGYRMPDEILRAYIRKYIELNAGAPEVAFAWQGGEPTMLGLDFFKKVIQIQLSYAGNTPITNAIQTNGTLLNDEWCEFLAKHNFLVGLSIDGPAKIHDRYRVSAGGKPTHAKVLKSLKLLQKHGVDFNILACINRESEKQPMEVYNFFKKQGAQFIQFIPIVERMPDDQASAAGLRLSGPGSTSPVTEWSVTPEGYANFMNTVFDAWVRNDVGQVMVMNFEWALNCWIGNESPICHFAPECGRSLIMEHNGDIYSCDHFVYPEYKVGNITDDIRQIMNQPRQQEFGQKKAEISEQCQNCWALFACNGGCPKHRFVKNSAGEIQNYLCRGYEMHNRHINKYMRAMCHLMAHGQPASAIMQAIDGPLMVQLEQE